MGKIEPRNNMVLLDIIEEETKSDGGIVLLHTACASTTEIGVVVSMGSGKIMKDGSRMPIDELIQVGSRVAIMKNIGQDITNNQRIVEDCDILYVVSD